MGFAVGTPSRNLIESNADGMYDRDRTKSLRGTGADAGDFRLYQLVSGLLEWIRGQHQLVITSSESFSSSHDQEILSLKQLVLALGPVCGSLNVLLTAMLPQDSKTLDGAVGVRGAFRPSTIEYALL
jgi:hypothetical protein